MPPFLSAAQASRLRAAVKRYKNGVKLGKPLKKWSDEELWRKVLGQVVVIGRAQPGERLQHDRRIAKTVSIRKLKDLGSDTARRKYLHRVFVELKVRYVGGNWKNDWKAAASARNFKSLMADGGPIQFFRKRIASCETEDERIEALQGALKRYGNKSARDTLIELRLAENCMALDARIYGVLKKVGVRVSPDDIYRQVERELREKVAEPLGIPAALLDRILFGKYEDIVRQL
jgi:hypothetical protein